MLTELWQVGLAVAEGQLRPLKALRSRPWKCVEEILVDLVGLGGRDWVLSSWRLVGVGASGAPGGASPVGQRCRGHGGDLVEGAQEDEGWPDGGGGGDGDGEGRLPMDHGPALPRAAVARAQRAARLRAAEAPWGSTSSPGEHVRRSRREEGRRQPYSRVDRAIACAVLEAEQPGAYLAFLAADGCDNLAIDQREWECKAAATVLT